MLISICATVIIESKASHCVSVIREIKVKAKAYSSPNSKALLSPNKKIKKKAMLLNNSTESYFIKFNILNFSLNGSKERIAIINVYKKIETKVIAITVLYF